MADRESDILIKFVLDGSPIAGESSTVLDVGTGRNELLAGFMAQKMFEVESFTFSVGIEDDSGDAQKGAGAKGGHAGKGGKAGHGAAPAQGPLGGFKAWRTGHKTKPYPVSVQPITFTRPIDRASTSLLQHCIKCTSFDFVAIVKRKPAGSEAAGEPYLRMDFVGALIVDVSWTNDDPIKETCKFISRAITVRYRPQLPSGKLGAPRLGFWSMLPWESEAPLR